MLVAWGDKEPWAHIKSGRKYEAQIRAARRCRCCRDRSCPLARPPCSEGLRSPVVGAAAMASTITRVAPVVWRRGQLKLSNSDRRVCRRVGPGRPCVAVPGRWRSRWSRWRMAPITDRLIWNRYDHHSLVTDPDLGVGPPGVSGAYTYQTIACSGLLKLTEKVVPRSGCGRRRVHGFR